MRHRPFPAHAVTAFLSDAGITVNGPNPWDIRVHDARFFSRVLRSGSLGFGDTYLDGWWDCEQLDGFFERLLRTDIRSIAHSSVYTTLKYAWWKILNPQSIRRSTAVALQHYDLGNDFYRLMLDPYMQYSCGYFKNTDDLPIAQEQKMDLICRKLRLSEKDHVLDIGCGWGGLAKFMAEKYGCKVTGITISKEQAEYARTMCKDLPVDIRLQDYRKITGAFDKVVSVGMFEHVGPKNYRTYMNAVRSCIKPDGLFLLHTIGRSMHRGRPDPWIERHIFPNSVLPNLAQAAKAFDPFFVLEDWHNFGAYYDKTLMSWLRNSSAAWKKHPEWFDNQFKRMWTYYLASCAGAFRARFIQLWQIVLSPKGIEGVYEAPR